MVSDFTVGDLWVGSGYRPGSTLLSSFVISLLSMLISSVERKLSLELVDSKSQTKAGVKSAENAFRRNHMLLYCSCTKMHAAGPQEVHCKEYKSKGKVGRSKVNV